MSSYDDHSWREREGEDSGRARKDKRPPRRRRRFHLWECLATLRLGQVARPTRSGLVAGLSPKPRTCGARRHALRAPRRGCGQRREGNVTCTAAHCEAFAAWGSPCETVRLPEGEEAKTWEGAGGVLRRLAQAARPRDAVLVALGGGSVGDVAGFVAGTYARGIAFVNVPTTLVAAADASIGGKTGINLPEGKNLAGVFHQPRAVLTDTDLLRTLPAREWRNGWAEIIKIAITSDATLFALLETLAPAPASDVLDVVLERACRAKAEVVSADERDVGVRGVLTSAIPSATRSRLPAIFGGTRTARRGARHLQ